MKDRTAEKKKRSFYLWILLLLFLFIIFLCFVLYFCFNFLKNSSSDFLSQKKEIEMLEKELKELEYFQKRYKREVLNLEKIEEMFVDPQNPLYLIEFLEKCAREENLKIRFSPFSSSKEKEMLLKLKIEGQFPFIINFLRKIETGPYLISLQEIIFSLKKRSPQEKGSKVLEELEVDLLLKILTQ